MMFFPLRIFCLFFCLFFCFVSTSLWANWYEHHFKVMGTQARVSLYHANELKAQALALQVEHYLNQIDQQMSPYIDTSELSRINQFAYQQNVVLSPTLFNLIQQAQQLSVKSAGAFDISFASAGFKYDYRTQQKPSQTELKQTVIDYKQIVLNEAELSIRFLRPEIKIDLGGIAKGYAIKQSLLLLKTAGIEHALVSAGGDTVLLGDKLGQPWTVAIKHPRADDKQVVVLPLANEAISTSGDYERFFEQDGVRYHHILNPKTGDSAREVVSVSVIGPDATLTDGLSTTVFVKGLAAGMDFINTMPDYEAIIIDKHLTLHFSQGLATN